MRSIVVLQHHTFPFLSSRIHRKSVRYTWDLSPPMVTLDCSRRSNSSLTTRAHEFSLLSKTLHQCLESRGPHGENCKFSPYQNLRSVHGSQRPSIGSLGSGAGLGFAQVVILITICWRVHGHLNNEDIMPRTQQAHSAQKTRTCAHTQKHTNTPNMHRHLKDTCSPKAKTHARTYTHMT